MSQASLAIDEEEELEIEIESDDITAELVKDAAVRKRKGIRAVIADTHTLDAAEQVQLLSQVIAKQFADFKDSLTPILAGAKEEKVSLKSIGNQKQFNFNSNVLRQVKIARSFVHPDKGLLTAQGRKRTHEALKEAEEQLTARNKMIRIADESSAGWDTVREYQQKGFADDEEDEKKIRAAERRAIAKIKGKAGETSQAAKGNSRSTTPPPTKRLRWNPKPDTRGCFECGKRSHWKKDCPLLKKPSSSSRYVLDLSDYQLITFCKSNIRGFPTRLSARLNFWTDTLKADIFALEVVRVGYTIPFFEIPQSVVLKNNASAFQNADFVSSEIAGLVKRGVVIKTPSIPRVVNPLTVSINHNGKSRLILDLRFINDFISKDYIKFDSWDVFWHYLSSDGWGFKFDLKYGYHHIKLHPNSQIFCGFAWEESGHTNYFVFTALPFGLAPAAYCFTKVLRPLTKFWRG